ncbi:MAG: phosphoribosylglycinamide formyltransferase [Planctomycetes bacterium]|nr:phosphoribosylglycinamide formyltransferase [Planctomycetota bacterium]
MPKLPLRLGVLLSGTGRTLENLFERIEAGQIPAQIVVVIGSRADAPGLARARRRNVPAEVVRPRDYTDVPSFSAAITRSLEAHAADLAVLAGFLHFYSVPKSFENRVINIHPALLPAFGGKGFYGHHVHEAVLDAGVKISGCTVHFADAEYDRGPIIVQRTVPVLEGDTPDTLAVRVFEQEKEALPEAIRLIAEGRLRVEGHRVHVLPMPSGI